MQDDSWATLYTSVFTSGLAGDVSFVTPSSVRSTSTSPGPPSPRRGSLPIDSCATGDIAYLKLADESFAFYQTLQPKRDSKEYRSFLSLDLAESQSLRSASLRRKLSRGSKQTSHNSKPLSSIFSSHTFGAQAPPVPPRGRPRQSFDSTPPSVQSPRSPQYAESSFLPIRATRPPRLPSIPRTPPIDISSINTPIEEFASSLRFSPTDVCRDSSVLPRRTPTNYTSSTVSTRTRGINRSKALAQLEGRTPRLCLEPPPSAKSKRVQSNFMNMNDDSDSDDEDTPFYATSEPEDVVLPSHSKSIKRRREQAGSRDWVALNSFIDLRSDDEAPSHWRSFIELSAKP
ncbi:hypothetical protein BDN72DRAFT_853156 [Pluteus cervinus]|uniref:Uncharacterized protein n=1 Tax=Pluteus cervinus TaxID=181527 RepID=A0ACD3BGN3_9AGAR|nr:hypothetical protein BDN72DRAFT_853156 [Pluteus cervinus]